VYQVLNIFEIGVYSRYLSSLANETRSQLVIGGQKWRLNSFGNLQGLAWVKME